MKARIIELLMIPCFTPDALKADLKLLKLLQDWGKRKEATPARFSLAWLRVQKP